MENQFGKISKLVLKAEKTEEKTVLSQVEFTAPFKIMRPFYEKEDFMTVMQLTASAGLMAGDVQEIHFELLKGSKVEYVSQAYEKIHKMEEGKAKRSVRIRQEADTCFRYTPLPTIPFAASAFENDTEIRLEDSTSQLIMTEVLSAGRVARGEHFAYRSYVNRVKIYEGDHLIYRDNTFYDPSAMEMEGYGMYEGFTHLGNLLLVNVPESQEWIRKVRDYLDEDPDLEGGVTSNGDRLLLVKILGKSGQKMMDTMDEILKM